MAPSYRLTRVEELGQKHQRGPCPHCGREHAENLEVFVNKRQLKPNRISGAELSELVMKEFGEHVAEQTLYSHFQRRSWRYAKKETDDLLEEAGADPEREATKIAATLLKSKMFERREELNDVDYLGLVRETRLLGELRQKQEDLQHEIEKLKQRGTAERSEVAAAVSEIKDPNELRRKINEIYGVYPEADPAALPGEVGGG